MVYVLIITYPYEGAEVLGVYSDLEKAKMARGIAQEKDDSRGYNDFCIEEFKVE